MAFESRVPSRGKSRRTRAGVAFVTAAALALTGCGPAPSTGSAGPPAAATAPASPTAALPTAAAPAPATRTPDPPVAPPRAVVGLGDSVMSGAGCDCQGPVEALARELQDRRPGAPVAWSNFGADGATTTDLTGQLDDPDVQETIRAADVIVVIIGANDLEDAHDAWAVDAEDPAPLQADLAQLRTSLPALLTKLKQIHGDGPATYLVAGYWNVFPEASDDQEGAGYGAWSRRATAATNTIIAAAAAAAGMTYVDLVPAFRGVTGDRDPTPLLADDLDHPNARGVEAIAAALADAAD